MIYYFSNELRECFVRTGLVCVQFLNARWNALGSVYPKTSEMARKKGYENELIKKYCI
ncbi:hypothetical protein [Dyadobacter sp. SG02]|uniref:hypothetical protein n=1 Tax=Dyadobacter sp. SG02 TaxID=1855291 RepID=UPI0015A679AE|nr:hypothetical protein [Dyadobacter sp. SG02]